MSRNIVQSQIQSLKTHPHIKKLQKINNRLLQMIYYPKDIKSHYAKCQYRLKIELPTKYPEQPPTIKFIDPIQHINISQKNGEVTMPILVEDWSPYISLYIIIDLIDAILVQPELSPRYCIGSQKALRNGNNLIMKSQNKNETVVNSLNKGEDYPLFDNFENDEISVIRKASIASKKQENAEEQLKPIGTMKKKLKRLKTMILEKSHQFDQRVPALAHNIKIDEEVDKISEEQSFFLNQNQDFEVNHGKKFSKRQAHQQNQGQFKKIPKLPSTIKQWNNSNNIGEPQPMQSIKIAPDKTLSKMKSQDTFEKHTAKKQINVEDQEQPNHHNLTSTIYLQSTTKNLTKINRIIELFTSELYQLQKKKYQTKNDYFSKMIQRKVEQQIAMIEQLQELSSAVKKSMISNLKKQINR